MHLIFSLILHFYHICHYTRFSDRVFIAHPETRKLLLRYSLKGIENDMHSHLLELIDEHAKSIAPLLRHLTSTRNDADSVTSLEYRCPQPWTPFIQSLAAKSPVCALVHCSDQVKSLLTMMITEECDVTKTPAHMILLQHYVPVLFNLIKNLGSYPHHLLAPILQALIDKAEAPFSGQQGVHDEKPSISSVAELHHLGFFPQLPIRCSRGNYVADGKKQTDVGICNKNSHGHPSLLPGVFTVFCQHG